MKDYVTGVGGLLASITIYFMSIEFVVEDGGLAKNPAYYPRALAILLAVMSVMLIIQALVAHHKISFKLNLFELRNAGIIFGMILLYILGLQNIGFVVSTITFVLAGILVYGGKLRTAIICSVTFTAAMYFIFHILLSVPMPTGLLF